MVATGSAFTRGDGQLVTPLLEVRDPSVFDVREAGGFTVSLGLALQPNVVPTRASEDWQVNLGVVSQLLSRVEVLWVALLSGSLVQVLETCSEVLFQDITRELEVS